MGFEDVYSKGLEVGWRGLSVQEHAVLLFRRIDEERLERVRNDRSCAGLLRGGKE
jgi:hypothetical protein